MTYKRRDCCHEDTLTARFRELNEAAERRKKQEANVTLSLRTAAELPCKKATNPGRDAVEAFQAVCQVVWYGVSTAFSLAGSMAWRMIVKGLGMKQSKQ